MREILFRGKDFSGVLNNSWVFGSLDTTEKVNPSIIYIDRFGNRCRIFVAHKTVGQYIGLIDKNGKKIFEGDIVKYKNSSPCKIAYIDSQFVMMWKNFYRNFERVYDDEIEVIGNIHDNPELLEAKE
mgnify:FL=1|nr:MAG TPA: YopX protein [Caudoviricetes sp.]